MLKAVADASSFLSEHQLNITNSGFRVGDQACFADQMRGLALV
jgi:hypothetical protein